jgi:hypothetical protein
MNPKDTITVTYNPVSLVLSPKPFGNGRVGEVYLTSSIQATGGTAPYTYTNNAAGTSLNDVDPHCAGLVLSSAGAVSGTPTTEGVCSWVGKVTDNVAASDTEPYSITIVAAGAAGPHDYFEALIERPDCFRAHSFRPDAGQTTIDVRTAGVADCDHAYYSGQLGASATAGVVTYRAHNDCDAWRMGHHASIPHGW